MEVVGKWWNDKSNIKVKINKTTICAKRDKEIKYLGDENGINMQDVTMDIQNEFFPGHIIKIFKTSTRGGVIVMDDE